MRTELWKAINRYVVACGGDPSRHVYGNTTRMTAVSEVEKAVDELVAAGTRSLLDEALNSGDGAYRP